MQARRLSLPAVLTSLLLAPPIHAAEWTARTVSESPDGMRLLLHVEVPRAMNECP